LKDVSGSVRCELVAEVDLGPEVPSHARFLLTFSGMTIFHESKSLCTTSSSMRKRAQVDDAAFFELISRSLFLRALPAELTMEDSPMVHAFSGNVSAESDILIHISTSGYPLRYRDRVNAKKSEAYASLLALGGAELRLTLIPSKRYPNAVIRYAALHLADNKATKQSYVLLPADPLHATPTQTGV